MTSDKSFPSFCSPFKREDVEKWHFFRGSCALTWLLGCLPFVRGNCPPWLVMPVCETPCSAGGVCAPEAGPSGASDRRPTWLWLSPDGCTPGTGRLQGRWSGRHSPQDQTGIQKRWPGECECSPEPGRCCGLCFLSRWSAAECLDAEWFKARIV